MIFNSIISFIAAIFSGVLAVFVFFRDKRSFVAQTFAVGMLVLAIEAVFTGFCFRAISSIEVIQWQRFRLIATSILPGIWLLFSLTFARATCKDTVSKLQWPLIAAFVIPLILVTVFNKFLFLVEGSSYPVASGWFLRLGWSGYFCYLIFLISAVIILMNLERIFRASSGSIRWQIKFIVLGIGGIFAFRIYSGSQALLFSSISSALEVFNIGATIISGVLITIGLARMRILNIDIYFSQTFLYNSLIVLIIGIYLLIVGGLSKAIRYFNGGFSLPMETLLIFLSLLALTIVLLSEQGRQSIKQFVSRYFKRPRYDYRQEWREFTRRTTLLMDIKSVCAVVAKMVCGTFGVSSVTIWLLDEPRERLILGESTVFSETLIGNLKGAEKGEAELIRVMRNQQVPVDFDLEKNDWAGQHRRTHLDYFQEAQIRYCVPLVAGGRFLGLITVNGRASKELFTMEDFDLLKTIADQTAGTLLNLKLSAELRQAKEIETFQSMSAFFIHDLKNLASKLSLTVQNLPIHFNNPEFRNDMLRTISQSLGKINEMCSRLSSLSQRLELNRTEVDFNKLVKNTLSTMDQCLKPRVIIDLSPVPRLSLDGEQMKKVLVNLVLNANEAIKDLGEIRIATMHQDRTVVLSVSDNGCGISQGFIEQSLFHPFKTTKKQGMGIGLYQSKMIIEAHQGRIEVASEEGKGSTFRVFLPLAGN